jgi:hypothetical protein
MPFLKVLLHAVGRSARRWIPPVAFAFVPTLAAADHLGPVGAARGGGLDWMSWLLVAGAVAAVSLAAWAFFAPDRSDRRADPPAGDRSESEPPTR